MYLLLYALAIHRIYTCDFPFQKVNNSQFECVLKARVKRTVNPSSSETPKDATSEAKINYLVSVIL